ncbi:MAG: metallophosphoesterase, partial [Eubacterium sp.]|nr:metallophosphoesterase [Eubacterium sp.]
MSKFKKISFSLVLIIVIIYIISGFYNPLTTTCYTFSSDKIPSSFDGYHITVVADFHCASFGENEEKLISAIAETNPDIIVFTGDNVDPTLPKENLSILLSGIKDIAPIYFVHGNDDYADSSYFTYAVNTFAEYGAIDMTDTSVTISNEDDSIILSGLDFYDASYTLRNTLGRADSDYFNILLYHAANNFDEVSQYGYDLVLCGHSHGGVIRLPIIGGIVGNNRTIFPKYSKGVYIKNGSTMIVS